MQVDLDISSISNIIDGSLYLFNQSGDVIKIVHQNRKLSKILNNIKLIHEQDKQLDDKICNYLFDHLTTHENKSRFEYHKNKYNPDILIFYNIDLEQQKILLDILSYFTPSIKAIHSLIKYRQFHDFFIKLGKTDIILPDTVFIEFLVSESVHKFYNKSSSTDELKLSVLKMCYPNLNITNSSLYLDNIRDTCINNFLSNIVEKSGNIYTEKTLENLCCHLPYTISLIKVLINHGLKFTDTCIKNICKYSENTNILFELVPDFKYQPVNIKDIILSCKYIGRPEVIGYDKFIINGFQQYPGRGYTDDKLLEVINSGYILTRDDLYESIKYKITFKHNEIIKQISNFLDKDTFDFCNQELFYPAYKFNDTVDQNYYRLLYLIYNNRHDAVIKHLQKYNIKPDITCLNITLYGSSFALCYDKGGHRKNMLKLLIQSGLIINKDIIDKYRDFFKNMNTSKKTRYSTIIMEEKLVKYYSKQHNFILKNQDKVNINIIDDISYYYNIVPTTVWIILLWIVYLFIAIYYNY